MPTAFVISGGGSRGDFSRAMLALRDSNIRPDIICSTSVGSLNALMAAQDPSLEELKHLWYGLRRNDHMWLFEDWWAEIHPSMRALVVDMVNGSGGGALGGAEPWAIHSSMFFGSAVGTMAFGPAGVFAGALAGAFVTGTINSVTADAVKDAFRILGTRARAFFNLRPIETVMAQRFDQAKFDAWVAQGGRLRMAAVGLNTGLLAYVTERGGLVARSGTVLAPDGQVPIQAGAMGSAAIAAVFPPVSFAGDHWVDGGHKECLPLRLAIEMDADPIYVISAAPIDPESSLSRTDEEKRLEISRMLARLGSRNVPYFRYTSTSWRQATSIHISAVSWARNRRSSSSRRSIQPTI